MRALIGVAALLLLAGCGGGAKAEALSSHDRHICQAQARDLKQARDALGGDREVLGVLAGTNNAVDSLNGYDADDADLAQLIAKATDRLAQVNEAAQGVQVPGTVAAEDTRPGVDALRELSDWCDSRGS